MPNWVLDNSRRLWLPWLKRYGLFWLIVELAKDRLLERANKMIDSGLGLLGKPLAIVTQWAIDNPVALFLSFVGLYCLSVIALAQYSHIKQSNNGSSTDESEPKLEANSKSALEHIRLEHFEKIQGMKATKKIIGDKVPIAALGPYLNGFTFEDCQIVGPAVIALSGSNRWTDIRISYGNGSVEDVLWVVGTDSDDEIRRLGAVYPKECDFRNCEFHDIGFAGLPSVVQNFREHSSELKIVPLEQPEPENVQGSDQGPDPVCIEWVEPHQGNEMFVRLVNRTSDPLRLDSTHIVGLEWFSEDRQEFRRDNKSFDTYITGSRYDLDIEGHEERVHQLAVHEGDRFRLVSNSSMHTPDPRRVPGIWMIRIQIKFGQTEINNRLYFSWQPNREPPLKKESRADWH